MHKFGNDRIDAAKKITKDQLIAKLQQDSPELFDQIIMEDGERGLLYYIRYEATSLHRKIYSVNSPYFSDLHQGFSELEGGENRHGKSKQKNLTQLLEKIKAHQFEPKIDTKSNSLPLAFIELPIAMNESKANLDQPHYFIPAGTYLSNCGECNGVKYVICKNPECNGRHIYRCNGCSATGRVTCYSCGGGGIKTCGYCRGTCSRDCSDCNGDGSTRCFSCGGSGRIQRGTHGNVYYESCVSCYGKGRKTCYSCNNGKIRCNSCNNGQVTCGRCGGGGKVACGKCKGTANLTCTNCYGDTIDNRYGKIDCQCCQRTGKFLTITYIESEIKNHFVETFTNNEEINFDKVLNISEIKSFVQQNSPLVGIYNDFNEFHYQNNEEVVVNLSVTAARSQQIYKDRYPKVIKEAMYYEPIPFVTFKYICYLTGTHHKVTLLNIDKEIQVKFHDEPDKIESHSFGQRLNHWYQNAFSLPQYEAGNDIKNEIMVLIYLAKANGTISEPQKGILMPLMAGFNALTKKERTKIYKITTTGELYAKAFSKIYFSTEEKCESVKKNLEKIKGASDGTHLEEEKKRMNEILKVLSTSNKPSRIKNFIMTWQISLPIILFVSYIVYTLVLSVI